MAPLVYLCARPQEGAAAAEYASFRTAMHLDEQGLERWDLVREPLPADFCLLYTSPSPRDATLSRMPSSA